MRSPSIRVRIVISTLALTSLLATAASIVVYSDVSAATMNTLRSDLASTGDRVVDQLSRGELRVGTSAHPVVSSDQSFVQILDRRSRILYTTAGAGGRSSAQASILDEALHVGARYLTLTNRTDQSGNLLLVRAGIGGYAPVIVVGVSLDERNDMQHHLLRLIALGIPLVMVVVGLGAWKLAVYSLAPVEAMRRKAERLASGETKGRLPLPETRDEFHHLASTLNSFLESRDRMASDQRSFIAAASHELRTPLAVIQGELQLALRPGRDEGQIRAALETLSVRVNSLVQLSSALLTLARGDEQLLDHIARPCALSGLVIDALELHRRAAERAGIALVLDEEPFVMVQADPDQCTQAISNLIDNALKHSVGGQAVTLRSWLDGDMAVVDVEDEGPGFDPAFIPRAFDRFSRDARDPARVRSGSGLGLALVRMVVEAHGGVVAIAVPAGGKGALLRMTLPLTGRPDQSSPTEALPPAGSSTS